jgi:hypothetical protein
MRLKIHPRPFLLKLSLFPQELPTSFKIEEGLIDSSGTLPLTLPTINYIRIIYSLYKNGLMIIF